MTTDNATGPAVSAEAIRTLAQLTADYEDQLVFYLNGTRVVLDNVDPELTVLEYLRAIGLTGTKLGCAEGGCGACTVVISQHNPTTRSVYHASVNACLAPLISLDGKHLISVEGIGSVKKPHPVQERIAKGNGSQCGFCTPGIVMSLYALLRNDPTPSAHAIEETFDGNLCRCTGYRSILDAAQTFSSTSCIKSSSSSSTTTNGQQGCCRQNGNGASGCCMDRNNDLEQDATSSPSHRGLTPPGFIALDPDSELIFPPALRRHQIKPLAFGNKRKKWFRPATLQQLLELKDAYPSAKIIGGSTEVQIEVKFKAMHCSVCIYVGDIAELRQYRFHNDHLELGGNVVLTDLEDICSAAIEHYGNVKGRPFDAVLHQIKYFAGRQIRNVATFSGGLATASPIADLNPVFLATNSTVVATSLKKTVEIPLKDFFKGYRTTALPPDAIISAIRIPVFRNNEHIRAYKQSKRKDDDISIVNAALRVNLDSQNTVLDCSLVYGGLAPVTTTAVKATEYLTGRPMAHPDTLEGVLNALEHDFDLSFSVPGGMPTYRKSLALSLFYRFYHDILLTISAQSDVDPQAVDQISRGISHGAKDATAAVAYEKKVLGKEHPHVAAMKQVTGEAQYTDDIPPQTNELYGCLVLSTKAHARLVKVDPSPAFEIPGVSDFVDHRDVSSPEANWWGAPMCDEVFFAIDKVFTAGQPIGMVLAKSAKLAELGARAVVVEYEELPAIFTIEEAIQTESYFEHYRYLNVGDVEQAMAKVDHVFTGVARMGGQEHFYLETQACVAIPKPEDGEMEIWSSTQNPSETQAYVAKVCGVAANKIVSRVKRMGGGFGGKETRSVQLAGICAVAAKKANRPVRCMLNRDEDIMTSGQRHPFLARWKVAVNRDGMLQALDADIFNNGGWSQDLSAAVLDRALSHVDGVYKWPNIHVRGRVCKTNTVSNTAFRGFGGPQGMFICESLMSEVADHLKMPVEKLREMNMYKPDELTHFNQPLKDWFVPLMYRQLQEECRYEELKSSVAKFNESSSWKKRGVALIPTKFGISFTALFLNQAGALVHIYHDGSVLLAHGGTEMGQGLHTKMIMVAAEALAVPMDSVHISETGTNTVANTSSTAASASSDLNGYAIWNACVQLNERLAPYRAKLGADATMKDIAHAAYFDRVNLTAQGFYKTPDIGYVWGPNTGQMFYYFTQGCAAATVEVDCLTGDWTCLRADIKMDVGRSINPAIDYGQIEGAFVQGMGLFTMEESLWHRASGQIFTRGPGTYKIPGFRDIPQEFNVSLLKDVEWENLRTIGRSRGVGEPPLFLGSVVLFAIRDALKAARSQWGEEEVLSLQSPATVERIRLSCADPILKRSMVVPKEGEKSFFISI